MKTEQLQIRVTPAEKRLLAQRAARAGQSISAYVRTRVAPSRALRFAEILEGLRGEAESESHVLAELNDFLTGLPASEFDEALTSLPSPALSPRIRNQIAAMVEHAAYLQGVHPPDWTGQIRPLTSPWFASELRGLRAHLLRASPTAFRRRNLFVDATIGDRV